MCWPVRASSEAIAEYQTALRINPDYAEAHYNLGVALASQGKVSEAIAEYTAALRINPIMPRRTTTWGLPWPVRASSQRPSPSTRRPCGLTRIMPRRTTTWGIALANQGKFAEAIAEYTAALRINPDYAEAHNNLGNALASQGKFAEAIAEYTAALRINPDYAEAHNNLGNALARQRKIAGGHGPISGSLAAETRLAAGARQAGLDSRDGWNASFRNAGEAVQLAERLVPSRVPSRRTLWTCWLPPTPTPVGSATPSGSLRKRSNWQAPPGSRKSPSRSKNG